jgi:hypothetical protein
MRDDCCRLVHEQKLGLLEFADLDWMKNLSTRYLAGKPVADFAFVGIAEHFEESMEAFSGNLGFRRVLGVPRLNVNPKRREPAYTLSREERSFIVERNGADLAWYEQACQRLDAEEGLRTNRVA